jgi:hypothetical protein
MDADRTREAFAAWDAYRAEFERMTTELVGVPATDNALTRNPLTGVIYADGYLAGLAKGEAANAALGERVAALDNERTAAELAGDALELSLREANERVAALEAALAEMGGDIATHLNALGRPSDGPVEVECWFLYNLLDIVETTFTTLPPRPAEEGT